MRGNALYRIPAIARELQRPLRITSKQIANITGKKNRTDLGADRKLSSRPMQH